MQYRETLENPPLLVVCDMDRIIIDTNFTATASKIYNIPLSELDTPCNIEIMRWLFHEPLKFRNSNERSGRGELRNPVRVSTEKCVAYQERQ
ncbi:MAG TPA: hypothetical protein VGO91_11850 [Pyrinomonadaceae bacterium]|nr:hypothetical protein [Pyrinomonadaceae bacterium]